MAEINGFHKHGQRQAEGIWIYFQRCVAWQPGDDIKDGGMQSS